MALFVVFSVVKRTKEKNSEACKGSANGGVRFLRACGIELHVGVVFPPPMRVRQKANISHEYCQILGGHLIDF